MRTAKALGLPSQQPLLLDGNTYKGAAAASLSENVCSAVTSGTMSNKVGSIVGFLLLGAILFGAAGVAVASAIAGADPSAVGRWASLGGALVGAFYGGTRK